MSAFGGNLTFGIRLAATDATAGAFRSALQSMASFTRSALRPITIPLRLAQGGLGILRDINLGLAPVVRGLDTLIERGTGLEVVRKSFAALTGARGGDISRLARSLVDAASGTLRMAEAMQIANRALGSGLSLEQLGVAIEFISKKAITTGKNASEALNTVITGLARGSTLFLDDFGILVDGIDGVRASFDKIHGSRAFDSLGPAAQKAETIRQAIAEMKIATGAIGVSGKETIFVWQGLKNQVGDMTDKLFLAVAGSGAMRNALTGLRDILDGISGHFERGGSFGEILFGGDSGGLLGAIPAALMDAGEALANGFVAVLKKEFPALFKFGGGPDAGAAAVANERPTDFNLRTGAYPNQRGKFPSTTVVTWASPTSQPATSQPTSMPTVATSQSAAVLRRTVGLPEPGFWDRLLAMPGNIWEDIRITRIGLSTWLNNERTGIFSGPTSPFYDPDAGRINKPGFDKREMWNMFLEPKEQKQSHLAKWWEGWQSEFPVHKKEDVARAARELWKPSEFGLNRSRAGLDRDMAQERLRARALVKAEAESDRESRIRAAETARDLRRRGWAVGPIQEEMIRGRFREQIGGERAAQINQQFPQQAAAIVGKIDEVLKAIQAGVSALTGVDQKLDVARGA